MFLESRPYGGTFVLDQLWHRLNIPATITKLDRPRRGRPRDTTVTERVLFALVAGRALAPSSKLAAADWISHDVHIDGLPEIGEQACYRAMDWLHAVSEHERFIICHNPDGAVRDAAIRDELATKRE
ncbi:hypothetical protein AB0J63_49845, partial [Streptosporangium canum]